MIYNVIGLMSGSSHDGLDIAFVEIADVRNDWVYEIKNSECVPFTPELEQQLRQAASLSVPDFLRLHTAFGRWMGHQVVQFIDKYELHHKVHFIASHGHTVFHEPASGTSTQIGDGASIAAVTGLTTITDLRNMDLALGGQGAPIVPIADKLLFRDYDFCLNIGGICNVTINGPEPIAFDIAPANQVLNHYAQSIEMPFDMDGTLASAGKVEPSLLEQLNALDFYQLPAPRSLSNTYSGSIIDKVNEFTSLSVQDILATLCAHIAAQISKAIEPYVKDAPAKMLATGGGAFNKYLIDTISVALADKGVEIVVPDAELVANKEALAMALIGVLRWREEVNVLSSATGAQRSSIGGAMWLGNN